MSTEPTSQPAGKPLPFARSFKELAVYQKTTEPPECPLNTEY
jgi:hypothetical protein